MFDAFSVHFRYHIVITTISSRIFTDKFYEHNAKLPRKDTTF